MYGQSNLPVTGIATGAGAAGFAHYNMWISVLLAVVTAMFAIIAAKQFFTPAAKIKP